MYKLFASGTQKTLKNLPSLKAAIEDIRGDYIAFKGKEIISSRVDDETFTSTKLRKSRIDKCYPSVTNLARYIVENIDSIIYTTMYTTLLSINTNVFNGKIDTNLLYNIVMKCYNEKEKEAKDSMVSYMKKVLKGNK